MTAGLETPPAKRNNEAVVPSFTFYNIGGFLSRVDVAKEKAAIDLSCALWKKKAIWKRWKKPNNTKAAILS